MSNEKCSCNSAPKLVFPCSGAADVGEVADQSARRLSKEGAARMFCLAGIGAQIPDMVAMARQASAILAIDGCQADCARLTLEHAGFSNIQHVRLSDLGMEKGKSPATPERIALAVESSRRKML